MSENENNNINENGQENMAEEKDFEESTIFSAPTEHTDKGKKGRFSLLKKIIAAVLCVAILASGTVLVVKLIPEKEIEQVDINQGEQFLNVPANEVSKITVSHAAGSLVINSATVDGESTWLLDGYDNSLIDTASLEQIVGYVTNMKAYGNYETDTPTDYGLTTPLVKAVVMGKTEGQEYTVTFGNNTADGTYTYVQLSTEPSKVYLVQKGIAAGLTVAPLDLAISTVIPAVEKTEANSGYFTSDGTLTTFDSLTLSGGEFKKPLVFVPNTDKTFNEYATYICTSPLLRMANGVEDIVRIFANGLASSSVVSFDQSSASLKKFGLDKPMWTVTMKVAGVNYTYRITPTDETLVEYYVASSTDKMIRTVPVTNISFISKKEAEFYYGFMLVESIKSISEFTLSGEVNTTFEIQYDEDNEEFIIKNGGQKIVADDFQSFYAEFIQTTAIDFATVSTSSKPQLTITIKHNDGSKDTVLTYTKISETRYQYTSGGQAMGQIPATAYDRIVKQINRLIP